jgi:16S rRNA (cytosine1402-N4)-methyltransferase
MTTAILERAYTEPLDQQDGSPLLHPPSPKHRERKPGAMLAEGLRMSPADWPYVEAVKSVSQDKTEDRGTPEPPFEHEPVMVEEVKDIFSAVPGGVVLDATVGAGGHAAALLRAFPHLSVVGIDRDAEAVASATAALAPFGRRATVVRGRFDGSGLILDALGVGELAGALFDLGVSSPQFDRPERGFSYRFDAALDMRMDRSQELTAAKLVNESSEHELGRLFIENGETRFGRRIAAAIVAARPLLSTGQLAEVVASAVPAAVRRRGHPAKRVFQALRIAVNSEVEILPGAIDTAIDRLSTGGRIVVISYHSGEDRAVKDRLVNAATGGCSCPPGLPCVCGAVARVRLLNRGARRPTAEEVSANPRAESARLRAAEALPVTETRQTGAGRAEGTLGREGPR